MFHQGKQWAQVMLEEYPPWVQLWKNKYLYSAKNPPKLGFHSLQCIPKIVVHGQSSEILCLVYNIKIIHINLTLNLQSTF